MPTVSLNKDALFEALGRSYTDEEFDELCFEFGLELDEVVVDPEDPKRITYKIEVGANRYDLLCLEGLARALLIFQGKMKIPKYQTTQPSSKMERIVVDPSVKSIRPHVVGAIIRNISLNKTRYDSLIDLQDKLHQNLARKRTLVAIGTHDLDKIKGPFKYVAKSPNDIKFQPLNQDKVYTADQLMELYSKDSHLKSYLGIIRDSPVYPVIYDSEGEVLSMPPIINGNKSKITLDTKNMFIECTATDLTKAKIVLDTLVTMFGEYCSQPFSGIESIEVVDGNSSNIYPILSYRTECISTTKVNGLIGINADSKTIESLLTKMCLESKVQTDGETISVTVPPTRHDILHPIDIIEDVAIAFGYNNIPKTIPSMMTIAKQFPLNKLSDLLREQIAQSGFTEALSFSLCSRDDVSTKLCKDPSKVPMVHIGNPKTVEFQVTRTTLLPGLLKTLASNKNMPLPLKLFEISDVILKDISKDVGARNERRIAAIYYNKKPGFETIHGLLDRIMTLLEVPQVSKGSLDGYFIKATEDSTFFPGRVAEVVAYGNKVGTFGVLHPTVIGEFDLNLPCSALEINLETFL